MRLKSCALITTLVTTALAAPSAQAMPIDPPISPPRVAEARSDTGRLPGPPTWPLNPESIEAVETEPATDNGFPWETIVLAVAGVGLAFTVARVLTSVRRRPRVAA